MHRFFSQLRAQLHMHPLSYHVFIIISQNQKYTRLFNSYTSLAASTQDMKRHLEISIEYLFSLLSIG